MGSGGNGDLLTCANELGGDQRGCGETAVRARAADPSGGGGVIVDDARRRPPLATGKWPSG
eukprot:9468571-Heterocapsa_arctica.AAC.1